jgi:hypothetical protein
MTWFKISCLSSADKDGWDGFSITALLMASAPGIGRHSGCPQPIISM